LQEHEGFKVTYLSIKYTKEYYFLMDVTYLPVNEYGQIRLEEFKSALSPSTVSAPQKV
jgi:cysteine sulfinate desulfinase/cysteine desulfurase-like protein